MSEPGLLPSQSVETQKSLWEHAPGWRHLTMAASFLTLAAIATPLLLPAPGETAAPAAAVTPAAVTARTAVNVPAQPAPIIAQPAQQAPAAHDAIAPPVRTALAPAQPVPNAAANCPVPLGPDARPMGGGVVIGFENPQVSLARMHANERANGAALNPLYVSTPRAILRSDGTVPGAPNVVVVPPGMTVHPGDRVTINSSHRDMSVACSFIPPLITADEGPAQPAAAAANAPAADGVTPPPPAASPSQLAMAAPDLPVGTVVVSSGVVAKVNQHNRGSNGRDYPITITILTPPAHGTVTTQLGTGRSTYSDGVTRIVPMKQVFYQSAPGYTGTDTFTYRRNSGDPSDPIDGAVITMHIDVVPGR